MTDYKALAEKSDSWGNTPYSVVANPDFNELTSRWQGERVDGLAFLSCNMATTCAGLLNIGTPIEHILSVVARKA